MNIERINFKKRSEKITRDTVSLDHKITLRGDSFSSKPVPWVIRREGEEKGINTKGIGQGEDHSSICLLPGQNSFL